MVTYDEDDHLFVFIFIMSDIYVVCNSNMIFF